MTYKQIETSREIRLWISKIIIPVFLGTMMIPEAREAVVTKTKNVTSKIKNKFHK